MTYVHYISETEVSYPNPADFKGVPNWQKHDALLRSRGFLPRVNDPEEREGFTAVPARYELVQQTKTVTRSRQVTVNDYETDAEHPTVFVLDEKGQKIKTGEHIEYQPFTEEVDDSFVRVIGWEYEPIPEPEPEPAPVVRYSKYRIQLACQKRGIWEQVKAAISAAGMSDSWANIVDIASDNEELVAALPAIKEAFGAEVVEEVLSEGKSGGVE